MEEIRRENRKYRQMDTYPVHIDRRPERQREMIQSIMRKHALSAPWESSSSDSSDPRSFPSEDSSITVRIARPNRIEKTMIERNFPSASA